MTASSSAVLARLDPALAPRIWRAQSLGEAGRADVASSRFAALDRALPGGGWPARVLIELLAPAGVGELRLLLPVLAPLTRARRTVMLIGPPPMPHAQAVPYAPALAAQGVALEHLLVVPAPARAERLWAIEQVLRSGSVAAAVAWLPEGESPRAPLLGLDVLRRLQLAAQSMQQAPGLAFLLRPPAARAASSPAPLRIALAPHPQGVALDIFKRRGLPVSAPLVLQLPSPLPSRGVPDDDAAGAHVAIAANDAHADVPIVMPLAAPPPSPAAAARDAHVSGPRGVFAGALAGASMKVSANAQPAFGAE